MTRISTALLLAVCVTMLALPVLALSFDADESLHMGPAAAKAARLKAAVGHIHNNNTRNRSHRRS